MGTRVIVVVRGGGGALRVKVTGYMGLEQAKKRDAGDYPIVSCVVISDLSTQGSPGLVCGECYFRLCPNAPQGLFRV